MSSPDLVAMRGGPVSPSRSALRPLGPDELRITGGFWADKQELNASVILPHCETWMERIGWTTNFDRVAAGTIGEHHDGVEFVDSEIYKLLEAMAWELARRPDGALEARYRALVARVAAAQDDDGYLDTAFGHPGQPPRYSDMEFGHELYCAGHLLQAAVARLRSGLDDELPAVARRLADHLVREFGPDGRVAVCGHPEVEVALAEFSRATGDAHYLELARLFIERRGHGLLDPRRFGREYFQDEMPVRHAVTMRGHAVRALYLAAGALDVAVESDDDELAEAVARQWTSAVARRTYITGGVGSHHQDEAYGDDFELPPDRAYAETCAGIASVMVSWRLLLRNGDSRYADLIERTLLNNILVSPREDGRSFFYSNTLHQRTPGEQTVDDELNDRAEASMRAPWFQVSCCPTNLARTLASVAGYFATATDHGVQLHQYGDFELSTELVAGRVRLRVDTAYPLSGRVTVTIDEAPANKISLDFRIPDWAVGGVTLSIAGRPLAATSSSGRLEVLRVFSPGDVVVLELPMEPRLTWPDPRIDAVRGSVAVERGPLVLALESTDLPSGWTVNEIEVEAGTLAATEQGARLRVRRRYPASELWPYGSIPPRTSGDCAETDLTAYAHWANRGPSTMRVWLPVSSPRNAAP
jgi:DUF1680 family protein